MTEHDPLDELLGAYALDALDPQDIAAVEAAMIADPAVAGRVAALREATACLVDEPEIAPDAAHRAAVLARAVTARRPGRHLANIGTSPLPADEVHRRGANDLDHLVASLGDRDLAIATRFGCSVGELLAHLLGRLERAASALTGEAPVTSGPTYDHWAATAAHVSALGSDRPGLRRALAAVNEQIVRALQAHGSLGGPHDVSSLESATLVITFEMWMHGDDIRLALGQEPTTPDIERLERLCRLAVDALPAAMTTTGVGDEGRSIRLVLTGPGGGVWIVPAAEGGRIAPNGSSDATMVVDGVSFCRLFHEQIEATSVELMIEGDALLVDDVLRAVGAFAERT